MNEEELKIGMYTEDEIFNYMTEQEGSMLGRSMYDAIFDKMHTLITETEQLKKDKLILKEKLEASEKARLKCLNKIKTLGKFDGENFTRSFTLWSADFNELAKILDIDKGE